MSAFSTVRARIPILDRYAQRLEGSPLGFRLVRGTFWSMIGVVVSRTLGLAASVITARVLGKPDFGALGIIQSTLGMFQAFAGFGLSLTATKHVAEFRSKDPERAGRIIALSSSVGIITGAVVCLALYSGSGWLATHSLAAPRLAPLLRIASFALLLTALNGAQMGTLAGFEDFKSVAKVNLITGLISVPLSVAGVIWMGLYGAVLAMLATALVSCVVSRIKIRANMRRYGITVHWRDALGELPVLWRFSIPAVLGGIMVTPVNWLANTLLVRCPNGYSDMAVFNAASQWRTALMFLPMLLMQASLPVLSSAGGKEMDADYKKTLNMSQSILAAVSFPLAAILMLTSVPVLRMYGKDYRSGESVLIGVILVALIQCIGAAGGNVLESKGRMWTCLVLNWSWAGVYLACVYLTVQKYRAVSLAYSSAAAYLLLAIAGFLWIRQYLPKGMLTKGLLGLACAVVLTVGCLLTPVHLRLYLVVPVTLLSTFVAAMYLSDRRLVLSLFQASHSAPMMSKAETGPAAQ